VEVARTLGVSVNLWGAEPLEVAELSTEGMDVTWGGPVGDTVPAVEGHLSALAASGASWAVCAWTGSLAVVAEAAAAVRALG
jgi:hypothetical protein